MNGADSWQKHVSLKISYSCDLINKTFMIRLAERIQVQILPETFFLIYPAGLMYIIEQWSESCHKMQLKPNEKY